MPGRTHCRFLVIAICAAMAVILVVALPGVSADGDEDQAPPIPEKAELNYPNLGSHLDQLVASVEDGETTAEDAAAGASMHREESVAVTIYLSGSVDDVVQFLEDFGGEPRNVGEDYIEAYVPVSLLGPVSEQAGVFRVREIIPPQPDFGPITSQGVQAHLSASWNQAGYTGEGIKVGIIDLGFKDLTSLMGTELPAKVQGRCYTDIGVFTQDLADCEAVGEVTVRIPECLDYAQRRAVRNAIHGTIVAESVIDIAPEVSLYIADPISRADLQAAADWMASEGVSVINYSVGWTFDGPGDGNSPLSVSPLNTVNRAVASDMIWVNAAGNDAREAWFKGYSDLDGDGAIGFGNANDEVGAIGFGSRNDEVIDIPFRECQRYTVQLRWEDDWGGASTDLDLHLYNKKTREVVLSAEAEQSGESNHIPLQSLSFTVSADSDDFGIVVSHYSGGVPDWIQLVVWGAGSIEHHTEYGSITNPAESANAGMLAVGAAPWYDVNAIEPYSSRGPTPDGRVKPDIVGADCGETALTPLNENRRGFCGTSQAAPHVAGMAALVRQRFPDYTPAQVAAYLKDNTVARGSVPNNTWGHGFAQLPSPDREALVAFYNATGGAHWTNNTNWLTNAPVGQWYGVITDGNGRVTELNLTSNQLKGEIPPELCSLTNLKVLALGGNELTGTVPTWLGSLANLEELYLWGNELTGGIPSELDRLANLGKLSLSDNQLTGEVPMELGNLANLKVLSLGGNELTGTIPTWLGSLANLEELYLWGNELTGGIPSELGRLANLEELYLWGNELTGGIPSELGRLANLVELHLGNNQLTGEVPMELGNLANLKVLSLGGNELTGTIPTWLGSLANLEELYLSDNQVTGEVPVELGSLSNLKELWLSENQLTGEIPVELGSLSNLVKLVLWGNELTGEIPVALGTVANLTLLSLSQNQLTGAIPAELGSLANLTLLSLSQNQLTGEIPAELGNLANLERLRLFNNQLSGEIPSELGSLVNLRSLSLRDNQLTGGIPAELGKLANLERLSLFNNQLTGEIPVELGRLTNLTVLSLSGNRLTGCVPASLRDVADNDLAQLGLSFCTSQDPLITLYDTNRNGAIDRSEVIKAINDYLSGEGDTITRVEVIRLINLYLVGPPAAQESEASEEPDGGGQRADADRPVVESATIKNLT